VDLLTEQERMRYERQMQIPGWGEAGQLRLKGASVFVAGAGGLGSPVAIYLAVAGVGEIRICDADTVELSNLNRQILHAEARVGRSKTASAAMSLEALNSDIRVVPLSDYVDQTSVAKVVGQPDLVVDCLDNYQTRYLLNDYCLERRIPFVHGAIEGLIGQVTFLAPPDTPCLRCIFPEAPPPRLFPVLGATPGVIGTIQAMEALKHLAGVGTTLKNRLLIFEGEEMTFTTIRVERSPSCPACGGPS
jgi:adenylyltransferase/sulfurtransferase